MKYSFANFFPVNNDHTLTGLNTFFNLAYAFKTHSFGVCVDIVPFGENLEIKSILDPFAMKYPTTPDTFDQCVIRMLATSFQLTWSFFESEV